MPRWTLTLSDDLACRVEERLAENCQNRSEVLRYLLERYLETPVWSVDPNASPDAESSSDRKTSAGAPRTSEWVRRTSRPAPTRQQLAQAQKLAGALGREIPDEALAFASACSDFIRHAEEALNESE